MKEYKGIVFFDYDGTTVDEVDRIKTATPTTVESLKKLKENGKFRFERSQNFR